MSYTCRVMDKDEAQNYLQYLLNQNFRVVTTDGRLFWGAFKCTDANGNIVLAHSYEYRQPSADSVHHRLEQLGQANIALGMTSRYLGLIVIPGHHIVSIKLEQFVSQMKNISQPSSPTAADH